MELEAADRAQQCRGMDSKRLNDSNHSGGQHGAGGSCRQQPHGSEVWQLLMQVASVELEAAAGAPHALSAAGRALLQEGLGAGQRQDWAAAVAGLLGVTNQDSTQLDLLQQVPRRPLLGVPVCAMAVPWHCDELT